MILGQYPAALQHWKIDAPLLAAGLLTEEMEELFQEHMQDRTTNQKIKTA